MSEKLYHIVWRAGHDVMSLLTDVYLDESIDADSLSYDDWAVMALRKDSEGSGDELTDEDIRKDLKNGVDIYAVIEGPAKFIL